MFDSTRPQLARGDPVLMLQAKPPRRFNYCPEYLLPLGYQPARGERFVTSTDHILCAARPMNSAEIGEAQALFVSTSDNQDGDIPHKISMREQLLAASSLFAASITQRDTQRAQFHAHITTDCLTNTITLLIPLSSDSHVNAARAKEWRPAVPALVKQSYDGETLARLVVTEVRKEDHLVVALTCCTPEAGLSAEIRADAPRAFLITPDSTRTGYEHRIQKFSEQVLSKALVSVQNPHSKVLLSLFGLVETTEEDVDFTRNLDLTTLSFDEPHSRFNELQRQAISRVCGDKEPVIPILSPPGTGKTATLAACVIKRASTLPM